MLSHRGVLCASVTTATAVAAAVAAVAVAVSFTETEGWRGSMGAKLLKHSELDHTLLREPYTFFMTFILFY